MLPASLSPTTIDCWEDHLSSMRPRALAPFALALSLAAPVCSSAAGIPCAPCAGLRVADPYALLPALAAAPRRTPEARLYVAWDVELGAAATPAAGHALAGAGAVPWLRLVFRSAAPLLEHEPALAAELEAASALAGTRIPGARYQVVWSPDGADPALPPPAIDFAYLVKRASVAVSGLDPEAQVLAGPLAADTGWLSTFYGQEVAAYLDGIAFAPADPAALAAAVEAVAGLDPGKPVVLDGAPLPAPAARALAEAARARAAGFSATLFRPADDVAAAEALGALALLANEFAGELSLDRGTTPEGAAEAWSFVRGEDLALRVVVVPPPGADRLTLRFPDPQLRAPARVLPGGEVVPLSGVQRGGTALEVRLADPGAVEVLRLERASIQELEGVAEEVTVATERQMPVEEVLRRLQAAEDAQTRRIRHWQAINSTTLRFQAASGVGAFEATFAGEIFLKPGQPFDWAWQSFYANGVRWRGEKIPEIPLVQPEKAAALPLEILFTKEYRYALAGTESVAGRDCWVVEFEPNVPAEGRTLFRGSVWVDRETWRRVRTRGVQLGLTGEVLSNEETIEYTPVDAAGAAVPWNAPDAFVLPLRTTGQQILSVLNAATVVEREVLLTSVSVNGPDFDERRELALASDARMVRDTEKGLRYLSKEGAPAGERVVEEGFDTSRLFLVAGAFYDDSLDYPLPLAGVNYFDLSFLGPEGQLNAFFGGVLGIVSYADPRFLGTKLDVGANAFAFAIATSNQLFRNGEESPGEEIEERPARVAVNAGFPLGSFTKVSTSYLLSWSDYGRADDTALEFVMPEDHLTQTLGLGLQVARSGYRLNLEAAWSQRSKWELWGLPGNSEFDPAHEKYATWQVSLSKNWYLPKFRKIGLELDWSGGEHLDRFSKYQFGFFGSTRVHGYQIGKVRAEEAISAHATYGFELGNLLRLDAVGDAAWATDETSGLERELLAGVGVQGTFIGPWETLMSIDVGTPVAGPDDGIVAYVVFLKLFD
jgi:hypothetical protein